MDAIDPSVIVSHGASKTFDFGSVTEPELTNFSIPLKLQIGQLNVRTTQCPCVCFGWMPPQLLRRRPACSICSQASVGQQFVAQSVVGQPVRMRTETPIRFAQQDPCLEQS